MGSTGKTVRSMPLKPAVPKFGRTAATSSKKTAQRAITGKATASQPSPTEATLPSPIDTRDREIAMLKEQLASKDEELNRLRRNWDEERAHLLRSMEGLRTQLHECGKDPERLITNAIEQMEIVQTLYRHGMTSDEFSSVIQWIPSGTRDLWMLQLIEHIARLGKLVSLNQAITKNLEGVEAAMQTIAIQACELLGAERATVFSADATTDELFSVVTANSTDDQDLIELRVPNDVGMVGHVFQTGELLNVADAYQEEGLFNAEVDKKTGFHTKAVLCCPIIAYNGFKMGVLQVMNKEDGTTFSTEDERKIGGLSIKVGVHLLLAQTYDSITEAQSRSPLLKELMQAFLSEVRVECEMDALVGRICCTLDSERASVFLADPRTKELWTKSGIRVPWDRGIAGLCFTTGETVNIEDAYADERFNQDIDAVTGFHTRNLLCVPLVSEEGETIGVIQAVNKVDEEAYFTEEDAFYCKKLALQASLNLQYAQLYEEALKR